MPASLEHPRLSNTLARALHMEMEQEHKRQEEGVDETMEQKTKEEQEGRKEKRWKRERH